jgi:predicted DNA-binding transcriptional regulator AlpA
MTGLVKDTPDVYDIRGCRFGPTYRSRMNERAITVAELARMLRISEWKARELGKDPTFPSFRVGGQHRFWPSEVREHLQREREQRDPWKQSARALGRKRKRDRDGPSQLRVMLP